jgi:hypothetical protein
MVEERVNQSVGEEVIEMRRKKLGLAGGSILIIILSALMVQAVQAVDEPDELKNEVTDIRDIVEDGSTFEGQMVVIEGQIENECGSGCWFILKDKTASIFVDILPSNFVIPQERGADAKVYGKVAIKDGDSYIIGKMVKIGGEIYR